MNLVNEKLDQVFEKLDCTAKTNIACGFVLQNAEIGEFRCFNSHESKTLFDKSMLRCTKADLTNSWRKFNKQDIIKFCTQEWQIQHGDSTWSLI